MHRWRAAPSVRTGAPPARKSSCDAAQQTQGRPEPWRGGRAQVRLADGRQCDQYTLTDDFVHLPRCDGVFLYEDLLAVLAVRAGPPPNKPQGPALLHRTRGSWPSIHAAVDARDVAVMKPCCSARPELGAARAQMRSQEVHLLQVLARGRLVWLQRLGRHCWDDDAMVLAVQAEAERRWQQAQARARPAHALAGAAPPARSRRASSGTMRAGEVALQALARGASLTPLALHAWAAS
jgi:hypothetical protein